MLKRISSRSFLISFAGIGMLVVAIIGVGVFFGWIWYQSRQPVEIPLDYATLNMGADEHPRGEEFLRLLDEHLAWLTDEDETNDLEALMNIGSYTSALGDYRAAASAYGYAIEYSEFNPILRAAAFQSMATAYIQLGEYTKAEHAYRNLIELEPQNISAYRLLADLYKNYMPGKIASIPALFTEGLSANPGNEELFRNLGTYYKEQNDYARAIDYFKRALLINPANEALAKEIQRLQERLN